MHFDHLVLDTAPLLTGSLPSSVADAFYTVPEVLAEIKDASTRERILNDPSSYKIKVMNPSSEALKLVSTFAKATGDYAVLSGTDLRVIALTVSLELQYNGLKSKIRRSPMTAIVHSSPSKPFEESKDAAPKVSNGSHQRTNTAPAAKVDNVQNATKADEGEWITRETIKKSVSKGGWEEVKTVPTLVSVACVTSDFAMQNVLLQMRLHLYTPDGVRVKRVKNWLLRCHACYTTTKEMSRKFCPHCGGATLLRTSYSVDGWGQVHLYLRSDFQYNLRGTQYSIPMPRGGRNNTDLILREDQVEYQRALRNWQRVERKAERAFGDQDAIDDRLAAVFGDLSVSGSKKASSHQNAAPPVIGYGRRNPNQVRRSTK